MSPITGSVQIARGVEEVFDYTSDPARRAEWQESLQDVQAEPPGSPRVGTRVRETRRVTGGARPVAWEYVVFDVPSRWSFRGTDGPVRPIGTMNFTPADDGAATRVDMEIDFEGHGLGRVIVPLARRDARKQVPRDLAHLKRVLEGRPPTPSGPAAASTGSASPPA